MNNPELKNLINNCFYSDQYAAITKKIGSKLNHQIWDENEKPILFFLFIIFCQPIYNVIEKQK